MCPAIGFDRPVARQLVHRVSTAEVFPTDFRPGTDGAFLAGLQWPRGHGFYRLEPLDSALVVESIRQLTILTVHLAFGVPVGLPFVMTGLGFSVRHALRLESGQPVEVGAELSLTRVRRTPAGALRSVRVHAELTQNGAPIAGGYGDALTLTSAQYARIRGRYHGARPRPVTRPMGPSPEEVGRLAERDVTVRQGVLGLEVVADPASPILFDHLVDHVPGAAVIESCLQAVRLRTGDPHADFREFDATFHRMIEFDAPSMLDVSIGDVCRFAVNQGGQTCLTSSGRLGTR